MLCSLSAAMTSSASGDFSATPWTAANFRSRQGAFCCPRSRTESEHSSTIEATSLTEPFLDEPQRSFAALVFRSVVQESGQDGILAPEILGNESSDRHEVGQVGHVRALAQLPTMQFSRQASQRSRIAPG